MSFVAELAAGLGLFFIGVRLITGNLKELGGRWVRRLIGRATGNPVLAAACGTLFGALTQSSSAITFVVISMASAGMVTVRRAVPLVVWANVGTSALVLLAVVDLRLLVLYLLAATGIGHFLNLDRAPRWRHALAAVLGVSLLFLGIAYMKESGSALRAVPAIADFLAFASFWPPLALLVGVGLTLVAQSSATVSVVAVTLTTAGLLTLDQTVLIVFGASLGSGLSVWLMSANLSGVGRQIALVQVGSKLVGVALLLPVYLAEPLLPPAAVGAVRGWAAADPQLAVAMLYLLLQVLSALVLSLANAAALAVVERLVPETEGERLSRPLYLYDQAIEDPSTALDLVRREQARVFGYLPVLLDAVRPEGRPDSEPAALLEASQSLAARCDGFLSELLDATTSREVVLSALALQKRNQILIELIDTTDQQLQGPYRSLAEDEAKGRARGEDRLSGLLLALAEGQHVLLLIAIDALADEAPEDVALLLSLSGDRSHAMDGLRRRIAAETRLTAAQHDTLYTATALFERTAWLIRRYALLLDRGEPG